MIFGGFYDTNKAQDFAADKVGILCDISATGTPAASAAEVYYTDSLPPAAGLLR